MQNGKYTLFNLPGAMFSAPLGINDLGEIVGVYSMTAAHSFILQGNVVTNVDFPGAYVDFGGSVLSFARGINNHHEIVGDYEDKNGFIHAFLRERDQYISFDVPFPDAVMSTIGALGINDLGQIVGGYGTSDGRAHGFLKKGSTFTRIDFPGAVSTGANGINNKGEIVGSYTDSNGVTHGYIFSGGVFTRIDVSFPDVTNISVTQPYGINDLGEIVGTYNRGGYTFGFLAKPLRAGQ